MRLTVLAVAVAAMSAAGAASAGSSNGSFTVTASVANSCVVTAANNIAFGPYDPANANNTAALDGAGSVSVRCTRGSTAAIALSQGATPAAGSSCTTPLRQMADNLGAGPNRLRYDLFSNSGRTAAWGCDTSNDVDQSFTSLAPVTFDTFGRIPAGQDVPAGDYKDTVTVVVSF